MFRVLIDLERTKNLNCGLGQYCLHLGQTLLATDDPAIEPSFLLPKSPPASLSHVATSIPASQWGRESFQRFVRPWAALHTSQTSLHLWHATHQDTRYLPLDCRVPLVLTIHDLNFLRTKDRARPILWRLGQLQRKVDRATIITTASQHAANEIREHLELGGRQIVIIPHGVCLNPDDVAPARPAFLPPGKFLFSIGEVVRKKNFHVLVDFVQRFPEYRLVIAGSQTSDYARQLRDDVCNRELSDRVILPGPISDPDRVWLYKHCEAFLFPSISEGFGLPVIEAMRCGRPVFSSTATSLPEVGGELAFYWDHFDPDYMAHVFRNGIRHVASDTRFSAKLRAYASKFTWPAAAQQYLDLYKEVLGLGAHRLAA